MRIKVGPIKWITAVQIYIEVLRNPDASFEAVDGAKQELIKLAKWADEKMRVDKEARQAEEQ